MSSALWLLLKNLLFTVFVPGVVAVYVPLRLVSATQARPVSGILFWIGIAMLAIGGLLYVACTWQFAVRGRGTPAPVDPPKVVVVQGPYRWVRNPMYLAVLSAVAGWALMYQTPEFLWYFGIVFLAFNLAVILYEERWLEFRFGDSYREYKARVNRWIPRRPRR